jgi:hypothetical protein
MGEARFPIHDAALKQKGQRAVRSLQAQIARAWVAATETETFLTPGGMQAECEAVAIEVGHALVSLRTVDKDVLHHSYGDAYLTAKAASDRGLVVDGLVLIRNSEVHLPVVVDPNPDRVIGNLDGFRVLPTWKPYADLPTEVRQNTRTAPRCHDAYRTHVERSLVIETLLDALGWVLECDPALAHRADDGGLVGFPLPGMNGPLYERRHPDELSVVGFHRALREEAGRRVPLGIDRVIRHRLDDADGSVLAYCGYARGNPGYVHAAFTEGPEQIVADILNGFTYWYTRDDRPSFEVADELLRPVGVEAGGLHVEHRALESLPMAAFDDESVWRAWWKFAVEDAEYYVQQRKAVG